jgi:hypothetical protein
MQLRGLFGSFYVPNDCFEARACTRVIPPAMIVRSCGPPSLPCDVGAAYFVFDIHGEALEKRRVPYTKLVIQRLAVMLHHPTLSGA